jgi:hemolysin III
MDSPERSMPFSSASENSRELSLDRLVHLTGILLGAVATVVLIALWTEANADHIALLSILAYTTGLMSMLACSAAYNGFRRSRHRELLRRLDHSAIFLMIAGTYTPFTTRYLDGAWFTGSTAVIWAAALAGISIKLGFARRFEALSVIVYLALGWIGLLAFEPLFRALAPSVIVLLAAGGMLYSIGVVFHLWKALRFHNAIWHIFVLCAAGCHYAAIVVCVA